MIRKSSLVLPLALSLLVAATLRAKEAPASDPRLGLWVSSDGEEVLLVEEQRMLRETEEGLETLAIWEWRPDAVLLSDGGLHWARFEITEGGARLRPQRDGSVVELRRPTEPREPPSLEPWAIPPARDDVPPARIEAIREELKEVHEEQQALLKAEDDASREAYSARSGKDAERLKEILQEVGWIDPEVFGPRTTFHAFMIVQHGGDLPLMLGALPLIEKAFRKTDYAQSYALVQDRADVYLGRPQRYGTQLTQDDGGAILFPLLDRDRVDELLAELGLPPHENYLDGVRKYLLKGSGEVRYFDQRQVADPEPWPE